MHYENRLQRYQFSYEILDNRPLFKDDRSALTKELASKMERMEFLHQTWILVQYLKHAQNCIMSALIYRELSCVSYNYSFKRGNLCRDIPTCVARQEQLHLLAIFVVKLYINNWNENTREFFSSFKDDQHFHVVTTTGCKMKCSAADGDVFTIMMGLANNKLESSSDSFGVEVDWVLSSEWERFSENETWRMSSTVKETKN